MKKPILFVSPLVFLMISSLLIQTTVSEPRAQTVEFRCGTTPEHNTTAFVPNFVAIMENLSDQMRTKGFGSAIIGSGPDANHGIAQCYGDLSLLDCVLCYAEARTRLPQCFPYNSGRIYLDGCFIRVENYTFFDEITGPDDKALCGNTTSKGLRFPESARRAVLDAVGAAPRNEGYAKAEVIVSSPGNESAYVLANCWKTVNASSCKACLDNASALVMGCLPFSEGRALNTGCFLRYSDMDFLNEENGGGSRVNIRMVVVIVASSMAVVAIGAAIGVYVLKQRRI